MFSPAPLRVGPFPESRHGKRRVKKEATGPMCYTRKDYGREEEARRLREEGTRGRRREEAKPHRAAERQKPLTEKVREVVGSVR